MIPLVHNKAVTDGLPVLVPITSQAQLERLRLEAAWDGHANMLQPTHLMTREREGGSEIVGCTSLGAVVLANSWLHTSKLRPLETVRMFSLVENVARAVGYKAICVPVPAESGMYQHMVARFGYQFLGTTGLFAKVLRKEES